MAIVVDCNLDIVIYLAAGNCQCRGAVIGRGDCLDCILQQTALDAIATTTPRSPTKPRPTRHIADSIESAVHDNGPGVERTMLNTIFDAFYSTKTEGMGLGLAISRSIIEAHGGQLRVESQPGSGTAFYFTLPLTGT